MSDVKERIRIVLNVYKNALSFGNIDDLFSYFDSQDPVLLLCVFDTVCAAGGTLDYINRNHEHIKFGKIKATDPSGVLLDAAKVLLHHYANKPKKFTRHAWVNSSTNKRTRITRQGKIGYNNTMNNMNTNAKCAKPFLHLTRESIVQTVSTCVYRFKGHLTKYIKEREIRGTIETQIRDQYAKLGGMWNSSHILQLKSVTVEISNYASLCKVTWTLTTGKKLVHEDRRVQHWILDGEIANSYDDLNSSLLLDQWVCCLKSPTAWITLDNYKQFESDYTHIELVDQNLVDPSEKIKALVIYYGDSMAHDGKFVFFKKTESGYTAANSNVKAATELLKKMQLMKKLVG